MFGLRWATKRMRKDRYRFSPSHGSDLIKVQRCNHAKNYFSTILVLPTSFNKIHMVHWLQANTLILSDIWEIQMTVTERSSGVGSYGQSDRVCMYNLPNLYGQSTGVYDERTSNLSWPKLQQPTWSVSLYRCVSIVPIKPKVKQSIWPVCVQLCPTAGQVGLGDSNEI